MIRHFLQKKNKMYQLFFVFLLTNFSFVNTANVKYFIYTRNIQTKTVLNDTNLKLIKASNPVKFIIHGWGESSRRGYYHDMTQEYLKRGDFNVIQVDWEPLAFTEYFQASKNTEEVGLDVGKLIVKLNLKQNVSYDNIHVIGHSLGAHVAGFTGKAVFELSGGDKIYRITALDAAGPNFMEKQAELRLNATDAKMVDATHTDSYIFGYADPIGTVDFYANGGRRPQPGCEFLSPALLTINSNQRRFCSHTRSYFFFIESINSDAFIAFKCDSYEDYLLGNCNDSQKIVYGEDTPLGAKGKFYFETNAIKPYAIKLNVL